jgi:hypothetical protein
MHIIFFHPWLFEYKFPQYNNQPYVFEDTSVNYFKIQGPNILNEIRTHFNCPTINGAPLEDGGGSGSAGGHFEKLVFGDETMVSDDTTDAKFTRMSLAVAKDSGWYEVDLDMGETYFWGKDEGCDIFEKTCSHTTVSEFCQPDATKAPGSSYWGKNQCSDNHMYRTTCLQYLFASTCPINLNTESCVKPKTSYITGFTYGSDSVCLNTTTSSGCYKKVCAADGNSYQVHTYHFGTSSNVVLNCTAKDQELNIGTTSRIICEDPAEICKASYTSCPDDCHHR